MKFLVLALALMASDPAYACHRFSIWHYAWPQHCGVVPDNSWAVEITKPPVPDERTPEQIKDAVDHDKAVAAHKDELNSGLRLLEEQEKLK